jgi:hypothetical protein
VEHVERQEERENQLRSDMDELDQTGDQLEQERERVDEQIGETREEWERKQNSEDVPGAQPEDQPSGGPPVEADIAPGEGEQD